MSELFTTLAEQIESIVRPICEEVGVVLYDLEVGQSTTGGIVRVTVDVPGGARPGHGVNVDQLASVSRRLGYQLDLQDLVQFDYQLEVTSPGIERTLRTPKNWEQNIGAQVRVISSGQIDNDVVHEGVLEAVEGEEALVRVGTSLRRIPFLQVRRARTVYDFSAYDAEPAPGGKPAGKKGQKPGQKPGAKAAGAKAKAGAAKGRKDGETPTEGGDDSSSGS